LREKLSRRFDERSEKRVLGRISYWNREKEEAGVCVRNGTRLGVPIPARRS